MADQPADGFRSCIFCGQTRELTKEHVLPAWLRSLWPDISVGGHLTGGRSEGGGEVEYKRNAAPFSDTVRSVCRECNNGWMSEVEGEAKTVLTELVRGQRKVLGPARRKALASWIMKTTMVWQYSHRPPTLFVPAEDYQWFYDRRVPPPCVAVWLGRNEETESIARYFCSLREFRGPENSGRAIDAYVATMSIGKLSLLLVGEIGTSENRVELVGEWKAYFRRIWPAFRSVAWPPPGPRGRDLHAEFSQNPRVLQRP